MELDKRIKDIVRMSYTMLSQKIAGGLVHVDNEASMQLQLGVIMKSLGQMYEFANDEHFYIELEKVVNDNNIQTWKSPHGKARVDIVIKFVKGSDSAPESAYTAAIELKYFPQTKGETTTDNRFCMLADLENLEAYTKTKNADIGYFILYTTNKNYLTDVRSSVKIGNESSISGDIDNNGRKLSLASDYKLNWDCYEGSHSHYFLMQEVCASNIK